jgi:hypothetical protein
VIKKPLIFSLLLLSSAFNQAHANLISGQDFVNRTAVYTKTFGDGLTSTFTGNGQFLKQSQGGITGVGIAGGRTNGEIDIGETISGQFSQSVLVSSIKLGLLFDGPEYKDVNEVAKLSVLFADNSLADFTLTASGANTAIWSGSSGLVTSLGTGAVLAGTGAWELINPFGAKAIKGITFGALPGIAATSCVICKNQSDYTFVSMKISPVPVPAAAWLFGSAFLGMVGLRRQKLSV